jgi:Zn-dependent protease
VTTLAFLENAFFTMASEQPVYYVSWVVTVIVSVVLHELGHGFAALSQGDETPRLSGHMTLSPLVHMGPVSLVLLFVVGIAWGQMPVNPSRFRSRHGDAIVSIAGPAVNLVLAFLGLTVLGLWMRFAVPAGHGLPANLFTFLWVFGTANLVLCLLNLLPIPPLDGSRVLASFSSPYRKLTVDPNNQGLFLVAFVGVFMGAGYLFRAANEIAAGWVSVLVG